MKDTPETDAFNRNWDSYSEPWKAIDFARQLERERDDLMSQDYRTEARAMRYCQERDEAREKYATEATEHMLAVNKICNERDEERADCLEQARLLGMGSEREARLISERDEAREQRDCLHDLHNKNAIRSKELLDLCVTLRKESDEARNAIVGWETKWKCAIDMAARAERERDEALEDAKKYHIKMVNLINERNDTMELAQQMSESNQVLQAEVRDYRKKEKANPFYKY